MQVTRRAFIAASCAASASGQQQADGKFEANVRRVFSGDGPEVHVDEGHNNFHTIGGRYKPFAKLLEKAGARPRPFPAKFSRDSLKNARILVIANALSDRNQNNWTLPTPSAFTSAEIGAVYEWVRRGGALMLIVDHMPFPGCAGELAHAFGIEFSNGYAREPAVQGPIVFRKSSGSLKEHGVTQGIAEVATFTGSAFRVTGHAVPLLVFGPDAESALVRRASQILPDTPRQTVGGWLQGALLDVEKGRLAVFGEAAMFSAQITANGGTMGMNSPLAPKNAEFLVNVVKWLAK
ncbi:MAG: DUF4350 domain-containing protein [Candidatus Solibacter usitatus]|nr:DUF4350 domain-containing protein [Candidatus Solibacter usitatus]